MKAGSLFSGIGGFDLGFERAGIQTAWQVEKDDKARAVLARQFPNAIQYEDVCNVGSHNLPPVDVISGGFPCQDVSVAGRREGLAGNRSGLWFEFYRILSELRPAWVVIENVPGLLSSNGGRDFATVVHGLAKLRYSVAWRVFDSQYFGVAQRRRRVFIVGYIGDGRAAQVLFEPQGGDGNPETRKATGQDVTRVIGTLAASGAGTARPAGQANELDMLITQGDVPRQVQAEAIDVRNLRSNGDLSGTLQAKSTGGYSLNYQNPIAFSGGVRRLTPTECERLQGFPDGWTDSQSDTQRYKQLGNAVTVNVAEWIARRIVSIER